MDTYISREVPITQGDEAKALHRKNLLKAKEIIVDSIKLSPSKEDPSSDEEY